MGSAIDIGAFACGLIGVPYAKGAVGPDAFDCWGLFVHVQRAAFGVELPLIPIERLSVRAMAHEFATHRENQRWRVAGRPYHGCAVTMGRYSHPIHIGTWLDLDGGGVLHAVDEAGVRFDAPATLKAQGWQRLEYRVHVR